MEVCVDNIESVIIASRAGAKRIELCSALTEGGLTPSVGLLRMSKKLTRIPIFVMIRPRNGNFVYNEEELEIMRFDINILKDNGADGFVFGILTSEGRVDIENCQKLTKLCHPYPKTFHRAFDKVLKPFESLQEIIKLGFERILTSGQQESTEEGSKLIQELIQRSKNKIIIMPGAGINYTNLGNILKITGAEEFHGSAKILSGSYYVTEENSVKKMNEIYNAVVRMRKENDLFI